MKIEARAYPLKTSTMEEFEADAKANLSYELALQDLKDKLL